MLAEGDIQPAKTSTAPPIMFGPKKDGSSPFSDDYRNSNDVAVRDSRPVRQMDTCTDSSGDAKLSSTLEANAGCWQIEMDEDLKHKKTLVTDHGQFRYKQRSFEKKNTPATFQRAIDVILSTVRCQVALVYLDDDFVFSQTTPRHIEQVGIVLMFMKSAGLILTLYKCFFFTSAIDYLGHTIRHGTQEVATKTTDAMRGFRLPTKIIDLRSFLAFVVCTDDSSPNF